MSDTITYQYASPSALVKKKDGDELFLAQYNESPIRNLKKLLDIYLEVLSINHSTIKQEMKDKIGGWNTSASLEKVIRALEKKCEPLQINVIA